MTTRRSRCNRVTIMTRRTTSSLIALALSGACLLPVATDAALIYGLYDDFDTSGGISTNLGPDGVWSFKATDGNSVAAPFDGVDPAYWMDGTSPAWIFSAGGDNSVPVISAITNPAGAANPAWDLQQGDVGLHQVNSAVTRLIDIDWTAPQAMTVDLTGLIWGADLSGNASNRPQQVTLSHLDSSETLISTFIGPTGFQTDGGRGNGVSLNYTGLVVSSGDIIRMRVARAGGDEFGGLAGVQFNAIAGAAVPEPGTWAAAALLAAGAAFARWRRGKAK